MDVAAFEWSSVLLGSRDGGERSATRRSGTPYRSVRIRHAWFRLISRATTHYITHRPVQTAAVCGVAHYDPQQLQDLHSESHIVRGICVTSN